MVMVISPMVKVSGQEMDTHIAIMVPMETAPMMPAQYVTSFI